MTMGLNNAVDCFVLTNPEDLSAKLVEAIKIMKVSIMIPTQDAKKST